jgi:hypothetical protein
MLIIPVPVQTITYVYANGDKRSFEAYSEVDYTRAHQIAETCPNVIVMFS